MPMLSRATRALSLPGSRGSASRLLPASSSIPDYPLLPQYLPKTRALSLSSSLWKPQQPLGSRTSAEHQNARRLHHEPVRAQGPVGAGGQAGEVGGGQLDLAQQAEGAGSGTEQGMGLQTETGLPVSMPIVAPGILRLDASLDARAQALPSLSFSDPSLRESALAPGCQAGNGAAGGAGEEAAAGVTCFPEGTEIRFSVGRGVQHANPQQTVVVQVPPGTSLYGTGEVSGALERTRQRVFAWNTDSWGYSPGTPSLYQSHPWVYALLPDGRALGLLADTTRRCEVDLRTPGVIKFSADAHYPLVVFGPCSRPEDVLRLLARAVGSIPLPPLWALGFHQCRFSYEPDARVRQVAQDFRARGLPCDVIWMDIDYMDGFRCFTFDKEKFPSPVALAQHLRSVGFKAVWMMDPGIKAEAGYPAHDSGEKEDVWVRTAKGEPFVGDVWPGPCKFPDFTAGRVRRWWAELIREFCQPGAVDGIWNDMNEPAVFRTVTKTMPKDNIHRGDSDLGGQQPHTHYHNVYGMLMARATFEGIAQARPGLRPFVLTRAGYMGSQRYAATWTGDNLATWSHLHMSIPMALNLALSGQPFSGPDIGGFAGDATPRLFGRWMGLGALLPFARGHSEKGTRDHEPWVFGEECLEVCRRALVRRYRLIPHLYTLFFLAHRDGTPVIAPAFFADPKDPALRSEETSFLLGPLLVAACTTSSGSSDPSAVCLPRGPDSWKRFHFEDRHPDLPLVYLLRGAILPCFSQVHQSTADIRPGDPLTLWVALDEHGRAEGSLFEDAGDGFGFRSGDMLLSRYDARLAEGEGRRPAVVLGVQGEEGHRPRPRREVTVRLLLEDDLWVEARGWDGAEVSVPLPSPGEMEELRKARDDSAPPVVPSPLEEERPGSPRRKAPAVVTMAAGDFSARIVPNIGGRLMSLLHVPSGQELLEGRFELGGYEEYCGAEYRSGGCTEPYLVTEHLVPADSGDDARVRVEADVGGGLLMRREFRCGAGTPHRLDVSSCIEAASVGAGAGGFSRVVCLRVHPSFRLNPATEGDSAEVRLVTLKGESKVFRPKFGEVWLKGDDRPAGRWELHDLDSGRTIVNEFNADEVQTCFIHWGGGYCNLELFTEERPVSKETPLTISHSYTVC